MMVALTKLHLYPETDISDNEIKPTSIIFLKKKYPICQDLLTTEYNECHCVP